MIRSLSSAPEAAAGMPIPVVKAVEAPAQLRGPFLTEQLLASRLARVREAGESFGVDGAGCSVALLDTGLRSTHRDFAGRVAAERNFTVHNGRDPHDASDGHGHGTNVAGIICASGIHKGVASGARIVPLKVLDNDGRGSFAYVADALQWIIDHCVALEISAVCLAFGDGGNHQYDTAVQDDAVAHRIKELAALDVVCCVGAGDDYHTHGSVQGMSYPAIVRHTLSVGAIYETDLGASAHSSGAEAYETGADRIAAFSQRLHEKVARECATDIFAPGGPVCSSGILNDRSTSVQDGVSRAVAVSTGVVLLLQELHKRATGRLPTVADIRRWLLRGAVTLVDGDEEQDNVLHTGLPFSRIDAFAALEACTSEMAIAALATSRSAGRPRTAT